MFIFLEISPSRSGLNYSLDGRDELRHKLMEDLSQK
jgi:hypothetical protein